MIKWVRKAKVDLCSMPEAKWTGYNGMEVKGLGNRERIDQTDQTLHNVIG